MAQLDRPRIAQLVHLTGAQRGQTRRIWGVTSLGIAEDSTITAVVGDSTPGDDAVAVIMPDDEGWRLEVAPEAKIWVNGVRVRHRALRHGDLIEFGEGGALVRFRPRSGAPYKSVREAMSDCVDAARLSGRGPVDRVGLLLRGGSYEMATQVSPPVRVLAAVALVAVLGSITSLWVQNNRLEDELASQLARIEGLSGLLESSEFEAFTEADVEAVRSELDFRIEDTLTRIEALETRATARGRVIAEASDAVVFLQGAYGFVEAQGGRALRMGREGANGPLTLDGDGQVLELRYTGTGFVLEDGIHIVTNRHVAQPWEFDPNATRLVDQGFVPVMRRLIGYLPEQAEPFDVRVTQVHDRADAAVLECSEALDGLAGLRLAESAVTIGDEVIVMGYPTGMRALLARADPDFVSELFSAGPVGFWELAQHLAEGGYMAPLATRGIVGQTTAGAVVYDADTTHGGSGGPVLTLDGDVVAVNAAILPEFGGSNLGVPVALVRDLLAQQHADDE
jgi:S1-C subfamily serine protease